MWREGVMHPQYPSNSVPPTVLLMLGSGRSGSTLLERALGESRGVAALGETVHMWRRGVAQDELCGCGAAFHQCEFWSRVGHTAYGGWRMLDLDDVIASRNRVVRTRRIPELLITGWDPGWRRQRDRLVTTLERLYYGAREESGAQVLVDSSKLPAYAALLRGAHIDLRCLFVVRDPRGVAYSWAKSVERPEIVGERVLMPRYSPARSTATWSAFAVVSQSLRAAGVKVRTVRYEDFLESPTRTVADILSFAQSPTEPADVPHISGRTLSLGEAHTVAGNPMRFATGDVELSPDEAWRANLSSRDRRVVYRLSLGLRSALGYE